MRLGLGLSLTAARSAGGGAAYTTADFTAGAGLTVTAVTQVGADWQITMSDGVTPRNATFTPAQMAAIEAGTEIGYVYRGVVESPADTWTATIYAFAAESISTEFAYQGYVGVTRDAAWITNTFSSAAVPNQNLFEIGFTITPSIGAPFNIIGQVNTYVPATKQFLGQSQTTGSTSVATLSVDIGPARAGRYILVGLGVQNDDPAATVTIGGITLAANINYTPNDASSDNRIGFIGGVETTLSGVQNIVVTWTSAAFEVKTVTAWLMDGLLSTTPKASGKGNAAIAVEQFDLMFVAAYSDSSLGGSESLSSASEAPDRQSSAGNAHYCADFTIDTTNAAFAWNYAGGTQRRAYVRFA